MSGVIAAPSDPGYFKSRQWHIPFMHWWNEEPLSATRPRGRRSVAITGANYKAFCHALYLSTVPGVNLVYELAESSLVFPPVDGNASTTIFDGPFTMVMTMNRTSYSPGHAAGEVLQGFGVGSMARDTPWLGQFGAAGGNACLHVRWNETRAKLELFAANDGADVGVAVDCAIQPAFLVDLNVMEFMLEWNPLTHTARVIANGRVVHTQNVNAMLPNGGIFGNTGGIGPCMFLTNGTDPAGFHVEAGFYAPRFHQPMRYQGI